MPSKPAKTIQIERVPETDEGEAWANLNERLNDLANHGYIVTHTTNTYILLRRVRAPIRREE